jgi:hypothetical protein
MQTGNNRPQSLAVRAYLRWLRLLQKTLNFVQAVSSGFWLGILRHSDLAAVDAAYYKSQRMYQDDSYNCSGLTWWERHAIDRYFSDCRKILITAAGGGREVLALRRLGYEVDALECNEALAAYANRLVSREGYTASVRVCERDTISHSAGPYDGIIVGWGSFMLVPGKRRRVALLRELRMLVPPGAPILLSFFALEASGRRLSIIQSVGSPIRRLLRRESIEFGDDLSPNYIHHFDRSEVEESLRAADLELVAYGTRDYGHAVALALPTVLDDNTGDAAKTNRQTSDVL